jgi:hypothetical protein
MQRQGDQHRQRGGPGDPDQEAKYQIPCRAIVNGICLITKARKRS